MSRLGRAPETLIRLAGSAYNSFHGCAIRYIDGERTWRDEIK